MAALNFDHLKQFGVVLRRAAYFITCSGKSMPGARLDGAFIYRSLIADTRRNPGALPFAPGGEQMSLFPAPAGLKPDTTGLKPDTTGLKLDTARPRGPEE